MRVPRYRWTWPHVTSVEKVYAPTITVEGPIYAGLIGLFAIPGVQAATGVSFWEIAAICAIHAAWILFAALVLTPRMNHSRLAFDIQVIGTTSIGAALATAIAVVADAPASVLWGPFILYATITGGIRGFQPSIAILLIHVLCALASVPVFLARDHGVWAVAGPALAAAFAAMGYHLLAMQSSRTRDMEARLEQAERAIEEGRLARDLHDVVGSTLGTVKLYADVLATSNTGVATPLSDVARAGLDDLRAVLDALAPPGDGGIQAMLEAIAQRIRPAGVDVVLRGTWPDQLPGPVRVGLARIVQEAIWNAIRHGEARRLEITCTTAGDNVRLAIKDDGCGFHPPSPNAEGSGPRYSGRGLVTMSSRTRELGGTFAVESSPGSGAVVVVTLPHVAAT